MEKKNEKGKVQLKGQGQGCHECMFRWMYRMSSL